MDAYALHLAMAALAGASVAAVSAYYAHQKTLSHLLDFALAAEINRGRRVKTSPQQRRRQRTSRSRRRRISASDTESDDDVEGANFPVLQWVHSAAATIQALPGGALSSRTEATWMDEALPAEKQIELASVICLKSSPKD